MSFMRLQIIFLAVISLISCKTEKAPDSSSSDIEQWTHEINALTNDELQSEYLVNIYERDQKTRRDEQKILQQFGYNSEEHKKTTEKLIKADKENLKKIEIYLATHGHPTTSMHKAKAFQCPVTVIHHAPDLETREKHFPIFYEAYKKRHLSGRAFAMFLNRFHEMKFNRAIEIKSPFREEFEIDTLIYALGYK